MQLLHKLATGRNILILLALFLLFNFAIVPQFYPALDTLDLQPSYTPQKAYELISSYGDSGRQAYLIAELTIDLVYPLVSALLFSLGILYTFKRAFPQLPSLSIAALIPFGVLLADYIENGLVIAMLLNYPRQLDAVARAANFFTMTKFFISWFELIVFIGLIGWLIRVIRARIIAPSHAGN